MKKLTLFLPLALLFLVVFCKKKDDPQPAATITIASPTDDQEIHFGDSVRIRATITAPTNLHGYEAWVMNTDSGDTIYQISEDIHGTSLTVRGGFRNDGVINPDTVHIACLLTVRAHTDDNGGYLDKKVVFHLHDD